MNLDTGSSQEPGSVRKLSPGTLSHQLTLQLVSAPVLLSALLTAVPHTLTPAAQCDAPPAINTEISELNYVILQGVQKKELPFTRWVN